VFEPRRAHRRTGVSSPRFLFVQPIVQPNVSQWPLRACRTETGPGGGILNRGVLNLNNSAVLNSGSLTSEGAGILNYSGIVTINNSTVAGNRSRFGGGIVQGGTMTINNSTISDNGAIFGAGIINGGALTIINSTVSGNFGGLTGFGFVGGGILNFGLLVLNQSAVIDNTGGPGGGGIVNSGSGIVNLHKTTVSGNTPNECVNVPGC